MKLTIIGCGHMGSAIISGALSAGIISAGDVCAADKNCDNLKRVAALGIRTETDNAIAVSGAETVILAVKPNDLTALSDELRGAIAESTLIVSICAGKRLKTLAELFGNSARIVRVMPNTPALVGMGMAAICGNENVTEDELNSVRAIFCSFGLSETVDEELFDVVTAVSGSGPAYVYAFIEGLMNYAIGRGMSPEAAKIFSAQTVLGAAKMALTSSESPQKLKQNVCSPGGTTIEAVKVLDELGFERIIAKAARACEDKSKKLSEI